MTKNLKALAALFAPHKLYAVGGCVRNALMGLPPADIDLAGALAPGEVFELAAGATAFKAAPVNPKIGALKLLFDGAEYEYTAFRRDNYAIGGSHAPISATFTDDIFEDAKRRDFTVNAIYHDLSEGENVDPLGGVEDLKRKTLKTCDAPEITLGQDGLRLMRLARFAAEYGFKPDGDTLSAATENAKLIADISGERIRGELVRLLMPNTDGGDAELGLTLLKDMGIFRYIIPELHECIDYPQPEKYHSYDVFTHIVKAVSYSPRILEVRLAALLHDAAKPFAVGRDGNMRKHAIYGEELAARVMGGGGLKFSNDIINRALPLIRLHMECSDQKISETKLRIFIQENHACIENLIALKKADYKAKGKCDEISPSALRLEAVYKDMLEEGRPFRLSDLKIKGDDLIELGYPLKKIGGGLKAVLRACSFFEVFDDRERQLKIALDKLRTI